MITSNGNWLVTKVVTQATFVPAYSFRMSTWLNLCKDNTVPYNTSFCYVELIFLTHGFFFLQVPI
jgi:hypothetical protein